MLRVLQFADVINKYDFIDVIIRRADRSRFQMGICLRSRKHNIAPPIYAPDTPQWILGGTSRIFLPLTILRLARLLRKWQVDVLHTHHYEQALVGWWAARLNPTTRLVIGRHYSDAIYRLPVSIKRAMLLRLEQRVNRAAARIVVPSTYILNILTKTQGISGEKIDVIPYGFEPQKYQRPSEREIAEIRRMLGLENQLILGTFGRLHEEKGHRYLLEALSCLRLDGSRLHWVIVGDGPERKAVEQQIRMNGMGHFVHLLGWRKDAIKIMAAVDVVVQPTLQEAFSQAMVEALWMEKPLIVTDISGARDVITDGKTGTIVPPASAAALSDAIIRLVNDPELRRRLGQCGHDSIQRLSAAQVVPLYEESYKKSLNGNDLRKQRDDAQVL